MGLETPTLLGVPQVLLSADALSRLFGRLRRTLGDDAEAVLFAAGYDRGEAEFAFVQTAYHPANPEEVAEYFGRYFRGLGHFNAQSVSLDAAAVKVIVHADRSFEASDREARDSGCGCAYLRGLTAGYFAAALGTPMDAEELRCESRGSPSCEIVATARSSPA